jgi:hypothetical protein
VQALLSAARGLSMMIVDVSGTVMTGGDYCDRSLTAASAASFNPQRVRLTEDWY